MNRAFSSLLVLLSFVVLFTGCATSGRSPAVISWPPEINAIKSLCDLTINWKDVKFSGEMSLQLRYPHTLYIEVYGPFGDTVLSMKKSDHRFLMKTSQEEITDEGRFQDLFHISANDFIEDITMRGIEERDKNTMVFSIERSSYKVLYDLSPGKNKVCWTRPEGSICMQYLEATFNEE